MPELPEVETIKNELSAHVTGKKITGVIVADAKPLQKIEPEKFISRLTGKKITSLDRRGKYLIFRLSGNDVMIVHLRMTGNLLIDPGKSNRFTRVIFELDNKENLVFSDRRRLGVIYLTGDENEVVGKLGIEPLTSGFTAGELASRLKKRTAPIKAVLLDQKLIAGVGNMYADEALFSARIHPLKAPGNLKATEVNKLHKAIVDVLRKAITNKGASIDTYVRPMGTSGTAHDSFNVAHRLGEPCPRCGTPIQRLMVRHRGSYFCPKCQKL